ncbi:polysaccharide deacetylase family protein [Desulfurococcus mucosus]|uniref:Polysaccharide deacetylase n=1 Tax=Desulfurococcus mucosus (strain ATCC 35584 / DSM 2162 / JCM 9187 / O7/1) TaxID=765177 RepID=E8R8B3_DESM0|nr:polysaccharide deacetylase family protein [Desulfurococcus mucosus]ADV64739.1 polysaccharide deacetylase [Desulfurococcus mucosus DSM 2162]
MRCAVLTFDDGYLSHYEIAKMLYRMDVPATFFIITGLMEYNGRRLLATRPELIREMRDMGHEIASHTVSHRDLTRIPVWEVEREAAESKKMLEETVRDEVKGLAYPYGSFNDRVVEVVRRYYSYGRTMGTVNRWNEKADSYVIGSIGIRHLPEVPMRLLVNRTGLVVLTMHDERQLIVRAVVELLRALGFRLTTLSEALRGHNV